MTPAVFRVLGFLLGGSVFLGSSLIPNSVQASVPQKSKAVLLDPAHFPEPIQLSVDEILSMPAANRLEVAQLRKNQMLGPLEAIAFSDKADFQVRWGALVLLAQLQGPKAEKVLERALNHKEWFLRNAALLTYPSIFPSKAASVALRMLQDKALVIRSAAIEVLQETQNSSSESEVREALWSELDHPRNFRKKQSLWIRPQILQMLSEKPQGRETILFVNHLRDTDPKLHPSAVQALEKITGQSLGKTNLSLTDKRDLWLKWAKKTRIESQLL